MLRNEKGQTLVEHTLVLGVSNFLANSIDVFRDHRVFLFAIIIGIALLILLLFWKPRIFAAIVFIAVLLLILMAVYRWVEYGHV